MFLNLSGRLGALALALVIFAALCAAPVCAPAPAAADEGYGIETMTAKDWKGMWGFQKRGFAECWLAGKRHQAARMLSDLKRLEPQLGQAAAQLRPLAAECRSIVDCRLTPQQLEDGVNRFYECAANSKVLLGDALHAVVTARAR